MATVTESPRIRECAREAAESGGAAPKLPAATSAGAVIAAFLATACCVGPLVLALLGLGGAGLVLALSPYRPLFLALTGAFGALGFFFTYRKRAARAEKHGEVCACPAPRRERAGRILLWVATALVALLLLFPTIAEALWG